MGIGEGTVAAWAGRHSSEKRRGDNNIRPPPERRWFSRIIRGGHPPMANVRQVLAFVLLLAGFTLVFLGLTRALGVTPLGIFVSVVAVAALLFTGGIWFGGRAPRPPVISAIGDGSLILFDVHGRLVSGANAGEPVASRFPEAVRFEVERHCATVLAGHPARFPCTCDGKPVVFEALPVRSADGAIVYGLFVPAGARTGVVAAAG